MQKSLPRPGKLAQISLICALLIHSFSAQAADQTWIKQSNNDAKLLLQLMSKYSPENAGNLGVDGLDEQITDLSQDWFNSKTADTRSIILQLQQRLKQETNQKNKQDLKILINSAENFLRQENLNREYFLPFIDLTGLISNVVQQTLDPRVPKSRQQALLVRLNKYAGQHKDFKPITVLAADRMHERLKANPQLIRPFKGDVEQALSDGPVYLAGIKDMLAKSEIKGWETSWAILEQQLITYNQLIAKEVLPLARNDHKLPAEVYANNLREFGVDISPEELISKALTSFAEIRNQMTISAGIVAKEHHFADADYRAVIRELKKTQIPKENVIAKYSDILGQIETIIKQQQIVTLPDRKAVIRLASDAENANQPAPHMNPPRLIGNTGEYGEFVLTTGLTAGASSKTLHFDDFTHQAGTWTLTAHEARPGHELQFAKMIETGVSTARAVFAFNSTNVEGWALYAEAEMQPFEPMDGQLFALQHRMLRAARAFLDPMVNLGQMPAEGAKTFLMEEVGLSEAMATQEVQRYTFRSPGQATSYFYGYQQLMETRQIAEIALRKKFERRAFNDFVLSQGLVPGRILREAVIQEFVPARL